MFEDAITWVRSLTTLGWTNVILATGIWVLLIGLGAISDKLKDILKELERARILRKD